MRYAVCLTLLLAIVSCSRPEPAVRPAPTSRSPWAQDDAKRREVALEQRRLIRHVRALLRRAAAHHRAGRVEAEVAELREALGHGDRVASGPAGRQALREAAVRLMVAPGVSRDERSFLDGLAIYLAPWVTRDRTSAYEVERAARRMRGPVIHGCGRLYVQCRRRAAQLNSHTVMIRRRARDQQESQLARRVGAREAVQPLRAIAQLSSAARRSALPTHSARLTLSRSRGSLPMEGLAITARVDGWRARVVLDLYFRHTGWTGQEGTLSLRLPDGATPCTLAFGPTEESPGSSPPPWTERDGPDGRTRLVPGLTAPWPGMREARMAPRETARTAYRQVVRSRRIIDPALLEWQGGGVFSLGVYPLLAGRLHRITVAYDTDLAPRPDGARVLTLRRPDSVPCHVELTLAGRQPALAVQPRPTRRDPRAHGEQLTFAPLRADAVTLTVRPPRALVLTDDTAGGHFAVSATPGLVGVARPPADLIVAVDRSRPAAAVADALERHLLRAYLDRHRARLRRVAVLSFGVGRRWWRTAHVANTPAHVDALLAWLRTQPRGGACDTDGALREAARPAWQAGAGGSRELLLVGGWRPSWGGLRHDTGDRLRAEGAPLFAVRTWLDADASALAALAARSGGGVVVARGPDDLSAALDALGRHQPWTLRAVEGDGVRDVLHASRALFPGRPLRLAGRGVPTGDLWLGLQLGPQRRRLRLPLGPRLASPLTARIYGALAVDRLEAAPRAPLETTTAFALHYRVPGRDASLVMLETEDDYARHRIGANDDAATVDATEVRPLLGAAPAPPGPRARLLAALERLATTESGAVVDDALRTLVAALPDDALEPPLPRTPGALPRPLGAGLNGALPGDAARVGAAREALAAGLAGHAFRLLVPLRDAGRADPTALRLMAEDLERCDRLLLALVHRMLGSRPIWLDRGLVARWTAGLDLWRLLRRLARDPALPAVVRPFVARHRELVREQLDLQPLDLVVRVAAPAAETTLTEPDGTRCGARHPATRAGSRWIGGPRGDQLVLVEQARRGEYVVHGDGPGVVTVIRNPGQADERVEVHRMSDASWRLRVSVTE